LDTISNAFLNADETQHLLMDPKLGPAISETSEAARSFAIIAIQHGIPTPALQAALNYFDAFTSARLPTNLIQGQRDFFGSHTYQRTDREGTFHTEW
jgi:6-phosphogluconate dehydrogenase